MKKTSFHENVESRCDCRIVREVEAKRAVVMAFNTLPSRREELVVQRERLLTGETMVLVCFSFIKFYKDLIELRANFCYNLFVSLCRLGG